MATFIRDFNPFITAARDSAIRKLPDGQRPKWVRVGTTEKGVPIVRHIKDFGTSKYAPHQGKKECARRLAQLGA